MMRTMTFDGVSFPLSCLRYINMITVLSSCLLTCKRPIRSSPTVGRYYTGDMQLNILFVFSLFALLVGAIPMSESTGEPLCARKC